MPINLCRESSDKKELKKISKAQKSLNNEKSKSKAGLIIIIKKVSKAKISFGQNLNS